VYILSTNNGKVSTEVGNLAGEKFTIYIEENLKKELKKRAIDENTSSSAIISELVKEYLQKKRTPKSSF